MAAIKRFFEKRKLDLKFKRAGGGHMLTEDTRQKQLLASRPQQAPASARAGPSAESQMAAQAALSRLDGLPRSESYNKDMYCRNCVNLLCGFCRDWH